MGLFDKKGDRSRTTLTERNTTGVVRLSVGDPLIALLELTVADGKAAGLTVADIEAELDEYNADGGLSVCVIDANTGVCEALNPDGVPRQVLEAARAHHASTCGLGVG